ncbi:hypothetical protein EDC01DRAFT_785320 [Geopyxis carbonaria]|nr:hypothetical protein EDC01DRAFT_785320 [Geopyxis carbonaria]
MPVARNAADWYSTATDHAVGSVLVGVVVEAGEAEAAAGEEHSGFGGYSCTVGRTDDLGIDARAAPTGVVEEAGAGVNHHAAGGAAAVLVGQSRVDCKLPVECNGHVQWELPEDCSLSQCCGTLLVQVQQDCKLHYSDAEGAAAGHPIDSVRRVAHAAGCSKSEAQVDIHTAVAAVVAVAMTAAAAVADIRHILLQDTTTIISTVAAVAAEGVY